ncbi:MAG: pyridoxal phosphate-dependent aminotransferase [Desulfurococcales archaeon]|nr:pyridoxal phosphate-dependent aminotransferase [Desulfurococcales archaeon]
MVFASDLPPFCLERWQSERETSAEILLSESGVDPVTLEYLKTIGVDVDLYSVDLGYGWTRGSPGLRKGIAELYSVINEDQVLVTTGSAEANLLAVTSIVRPGDIVVVDMPNYMQVHGLLQARRAEIYEAWRSPQNGWSMPIEDLLELLKKRKPRAVFITNPNNPTGRVEREALESLAEEAAKHETVIIVDEVYRGLEHSTTPAPSILEYASKYNVPAVSVAGLSKVYGLPGLRIGWIASTDSGIVEKAWSVKDYTTISPPRLSEAVAEAVLSPHIRGKLVERAQRIVRRNLELLREELAGAEGLVEPWWPEAGAFMLLRIPWARNTLGLSQRMYTDYGLLVNPGECFELPGVIRIGLGTSDEESARKAYSMLFKALRELKEKGG